MVSLPVARSILWLLMFACVIVVAGLNSRFLWIDVRSVFHRASDHLGKHDAELFLHLYTAPLVLVVGSILVLGRLRRVWPVVHRWLGRGYLSLVLLTSLATLRLALNETEGPLAVAGFSTLSVLWFTTGAMAWYCALTGRYDEHRDWMIRNYALTLTNVTFRVELHAFLALGADFFSVYEPLRTLQFLPNLLVAEMLIRLGFFEVAAWRDLRLPTLFRSLRVE